MSKALTVLKVFFSLVSINSTEKPSSVSSSSTGPSRSTLATTKLTPNVFQGTAHVGRAFRIPIPQQTIDAVNGEIKNPRFTMTTSNNGKILQTSWVQFDAKSREVYGFPLPGNVGTFTYKVVVDSVKGDLKYEIIFKLRVKEDGIEYSHELILTTGTNFQRFMTNVEMRIDFATKLARYCFNEKPAKILVKSFNKASRNMTIVFANIPYSPCNEDTYSKLRSRILDEETNVIEQKFQNALTTRFPIESAHFKFFGACDPKLFGPDPPFQWGWLAHFIPVAILLSVVGIPVTISCLVKRSKTKRPVVQEKRTPRTLRRRNEDGTMDFTSHTVHFNNRYPSMLSVSNNSKEDGVGEDGKDHGGKANIPNGSPSSKHLTVPNATGGHPRQGTAAATDRTKNSANQNNPFKFPFNVKDRASFNVRAMWDDDGDDTARPPLDIPVYYTYRNNDEEEPSMLNAVLDMNFSDIAGNISTKLRGVKSMLNISQAEIAERQEATKPFGESSTSGLSLSSKLKDLGKSMLNISAPTNESVGATSAGQTTLPSLSNKLRDFGKSMLNISIGAQSDDKKDSENSEECQKTSFDDSDDSESYIYKPREYEDVRSERQRYEDARRRPDFTRDDGSVHRQSICRQSNASEYELSQYIPARRHSSTSDNQQRILSQGRRHSISSDYHQRTQEHFDNYDYDFGEGERKSNRRASRESDFDEYPDSLFDAPSEQGLEDKFDHEKSIFDTDFDDEHTPCITKSTPIWNHVSAVKSRGGLGIESFPLIEVKYQDYTNPHQYTNGRVPRGKPSYSALGSNSYSSQSTLDFWDDEEYERRNSWKSSLRAKDDFFTSFNTSVPDLRRGKSKGGIPNGTKPQSKSKASLGKSLLPNVGSLFSRDSRDVRDTREKPPVVFTLGDDDEEDEREQEMERDNSMVGLIKTKVSSLLEPDGNVSKWFSGFNKSDNPVT